MDFETSTTELESNMKDLTSAISAVDLKIKWFKKTDCVCSYNNGQLINYEGKEDEPSKEPERENISPLKNESGVGVYLCKVTCEDRIKEINISLKEAPGTEQTSTLKLNDKEMNNEERLKMTYSALLTVFSTLQEVLQTDRQGDEAAKNLYKQQQECPDYHKKDNNTSVQQTSIKFEVKLAQTEISPSQPDDKNNLGSTQLDCAAMETSPSQSHEKNLGDPQQTCADQGQIQSSISSHKDTKKSRQSQIKKLKKEKQVARVFSILSGKMYDIHKKFIVDLKTRIDDLTEAHGVEDSDVVLIFCPIVSRAGTDIDAALAKIQYSTASKLTVLVVLHHTFDPEKTVSDSSKSVNKENLLTVDCLFYEDYGLLDCQRNSDAFDKSVNWLIQQGHKIGVNISPRQSDTYMQRFYKYIGRTKQEETPQKIDNEQQMTSTFSSAVKFFMNVTGDVQEHHDDFIKALQEQMNLRMVTTVEDSDVILLFCSEIIGHTKTGKPVVLILLDRTMGPESDFSKRFFPVHCFVPEGKGLLDCQMNREKISDVSTFLKARDCSGHK